MPKTPKHILVIRLSAMGDVAMIVPVLRAFTQKYPEIKITVLTRRFFTPFFRDIPTVEVFNADVKGRHKGIFGLYGLSKELKLLGVDAVADLHNVLRSKALKVFLQGIPFVQIDKGRAEKKNLTSGKKFVQLKTTHQRYAEVFEALGFKIDLTHPTFPGVKLLSESVRSVLGNKTQKWIGVAPFAQYESKMYPLNLLQEVIKTLVSNNEAKVLLFGGGKSEITQLEDLQATYENVINIAGKFTLNEELDIISNLDVMLSMDSGNAHIAAMLGKKVITIWGVTHPYAGFYPFYQDETWAIMADRNKYPRIPTSVYGNKYPESYQNAIESISPDTIIKTINSVL